MDGISLLQDLAVILVVAGAQVMGIERGERRFINPETGQSFLEGDNLLVLGSAAEIRHFRQWLAWIP